MDEVKILEDTGAIIVKKSTAAGLASGYQRMSSTSASAASMETAGGIFLVDIFALPSFTIFDINECPEYDKKATDDPALEMVAGYRELSQRNNILAEELLPISLESWPKWEE